MTMDPPRCGDALHAYEVFGLVVRSEIELPELLPARGGRDHDVEILRGSFPPLVGEAVHTLGMTAAGALLNVPGAGRYLIRDGREIVVEPAPDATDRNMRLYLLGSAIGALLHQRGILPLHANAMDFGGKAVAFMGASGAGKSTMAAWFHDRGIIVLADDVCAVRFEEGVPFAEPGIPRLRLWRDALEASGRAAAGYDLSFDDAEKYNVPTQTAPARDALPLRAVYLLDEPDPDRGETAIRRLNGAATAEALIANTYRGGYIEMLTESSAHFRACLALAAAVPVFAVSRAWGAGRFDKEMGIIEGHVRAMLDQA